MEERRERDFGEANAYWLDGLEYGYEEEYRVNWGHDKELPVWLSTKLCIDLTVGRD